MTSRAAVIRDACFGEALMCPQRVGWMMGVLSDTDREKRDETADGQFYDSPRYVTHASEAFCERLTRLYADVFEPGDIVLDAMGSWVSHFPDTRLERCIGHGLNDAELASNDRYDEWWVRDLNQDRTLPIADATCDVVCCALSVQYLQYPEAVFAEFNRILDDEGSIVVSFTNRLFPTKAINAWRTASMDERADLVASYLRAGDMAVSDRVTDHTMTDPFYAVIGHAGPGSSG